MRPRRETLGRKWIRKLKRFGKRAGILVVSLLAVGYGYMRFDFITKSDRLNLEIDKARAYGLPLEPRDMERNPPVPDDRNAALSYQKCLPPSGEYEHPTSWSQLPEMSLLVADEEVRATFRSYLELHRSALAEIRLASKKPDCDFKRNWELGPNLLFPEFARLKSATKWLAAEATTDALDGNWDRAINNIEAIGRIARHAGQDRIYFSLGVEIAIESIGLRTVEQLASMPNLPNGKLMVLRAVVANLPTPALLESYLRGEVFFGYWYVRNLGRFLDQWDEEQRRLEESNDDVIICGDDPLGSMRHFIFPPLIERELVERANAAECLSFWNATFWAIRNENVPLNQIGARMDCFSMERYGSAKPWMQLAAIIMPILSQAGTSQIKRIAMRRCTLALLEAVAYRRNRGRLPSSLSQIGRYVDPFGGAGLAFKRTENGFRIYSIGADGIDGAGKLSNEMKDGERRSDDVIACFPSSDRIRISSDESWRANYLKSVAKYEGKQTSVKESSPTASGH